MFDDSRSFVTRAFLQAQYELEYRTYTDDMDALLRDRLEAWDDRLHLSETQAEGAFTQTFFVDTWGYGETGRVPREEQTVIPKFAVAGEGAGGGSGEADLALGWFRGRADAIPQVLCEFKDIRSKLDAKQNRKGSARSPVEQCLNYLRGARRGLFGNEPVQPWWGLVTDMNEFRLYWWDRAPGQFARFVIRREKDLLSGSYDLLTLSDDARFDRFLFSKLFARDTLLSEAGRPPLLRLIERQWTRERKLEGDFYDRYRGVRERLFNAISIGNPGVAKTPTDLLRLSQKLLDRFIFAFFCEDMGQRMLFPPDLVKERIRSRSIEPDYEEMGDELWLHFKRLFARMNDGKKFGRADMPEINGGLFAPDPAIDALFIPNHVFAKAGQGRNPASLASDPNTLLFLCASYNYAGRGDVKESVSLYTLGRIFEQSITELEYKAGELEGRETFASLNKRKRDGVYYTPEPVVNYLVEETLGPWFAEARRSCGVPDAGDGLPDAKAAQAYAKRLATIRIVDPACGSGAFLISAFRYLLTERISAARDVERARGHGATAIDEAPIIASILQHNIYGVDINPASVEIAKLALWLHSARAASPLSSLDHTLRCGNSLVGEDFWIGRSSDPAVAERVNTFDWRKAFPEIWPDGSSGGGFDIVLGNPPYVKLQNLMKADPDVVAYLTGKRGEDTYESAQTGNFDLYLPFIEKGLRLLGPGGRMAYIAPSLWAVNEYGKGLRSTLSKSRQLDRWIDFKSHQIFSEAITYTALQFFTRGATNAVRISIQPEGAFSDVSWSDPDLALSHEALPGDSEWLMATGVERELIDRLRRDCLRLDDPSLTSAIYQGLITSADAIYHLERLRSGRYLCTPPKKPAGKGKSTRPSAYEVEIEDSIMRPLISGAEAKRYEDPQTSTYLLFPYERDTRGVMRLIPAKTMAKRYGKAWAYLKSWEKDLRARESNGFDDEAWYRFGRNQSIDKQDVAKLIVAQTVPELRVCSDEQSDKYLNNVRVNGILPLDGADRRFLLGTLNGNVADFVFRRTGRPKQGGYFEANKQFIAPLPVPDASPKDRRDVGRRARALQASWTRRRELLDETEARLGVLARRVQPARWLWPDLPALPAMIAAAPKALRLTSERRVWAESRLDEEGAIRLAALQAALDRGGRRDARFRKGELRLHVEGESVLQGIFFDDGPGTLAAAHWQWVLISMAPKEAGRFVSELRRLPTGHDTPAGRQFIERVAALQSETEAIARAEKAMNDLLYGLYELSPEERALVENDRQRRRAAALPGALG